nr:MAG TPA: hypothetical protein [Caudoviricetes sp.]
MRITAILSKDCTVVICQKREVLAVMLHFR